jgi:D-alanine-D-alanine ligase
MRVAIIFDQVTPEDIVADRDVMQQATIVSQSLKRLGFNHILVPCTLDLREMMRLMRSYKPDTVFNCVDTLDSQDCLSHLPCAVLEANRIPHTGSSAITISYTTRKVAVKRMLETNGIGTPRCIIRKKYDFKGIAVRKWILKGANEDGSFGINDKAVFEGTDLELFGRMAEWDKETGRTCFAEEYIDGREFTVPYLCGRILSPAEIVFNDYPEGKPKILGQEAKWQPDSFESKHTSTAFPFDRYLLDWKCCNLYDEIVQSTQKCIDSFGLKGWGRIDFRLTHDMHPLVIDVNCNSCLAPDAWFAESLKNDGDLFDEAITAILLENQ